MKHFCEQIKNYIDMDSIFTCNIKDCPYYK